MTALTESAPAPLPRADQIEVPILHELQALGGSDSPRYLEERLRSYFPQLDGAAPLELRRRFLRVVRRAGAHLSQLGELQRERDRWQLTDKGRRRAAAERLDTPAPDGGSASAALSHRQIQALLQELGQLLGRHAQCEFQFYDVVWRDTPRSPRLSHVFEVQVAGSVDSALTRLLQAHEAQRSQLFLVIADERSQRFAEERLRRAFPALVPLLTLIGVGELQRLHAALQQQTELLGRLLARG